MLDNYQQEIKETNEPIVIEYQKKLQKLEEIELSNEDN